MKFVIGSRGSKLALTQTHWVRDRLQTLEPDLDIEVAEIRTTGDTAKGSLRSFGGAGVFTKELERALLDGRVDLAVHSLKDLPTDVHPDLALVAAPEREDVRDTLIGPNLTALDDLPQGALIGTGSLRRQAQLKALRPDLSFADIRGNLDTRIDKAMRGECDAVVLAAAGLHRLGWHGRISAYLTTDEILPAPGQAALGLQMRADHPLRDRVAFLDDPATAAAVRAERQLLQTLRAGCHAPVGAWGRSQGDDLILDGLVGDPEGTRILHASLRAPLAAAVDLGQALAAELRERGADDLLQDR